MKWYIHFLAETATIVLESTTGDKVIEEAYELDKTEQLWTKGDHDAEGYFTLKNSKGKRYMTAISETSLEIQGTVTLRWIVQ